MADILAVVSDLHCNHPFGLLPAEGIDDTNGNHFSANLVQRWSWDRWLAFWQEVGVAHSRESGKLYVLVNGELVDGFHHHSTEFLSASKVTMRAIARAVMQPALDLDPASIFVIRGTEAHSGMQGEDDEVLARDLRAVRDPVTGAASFYHVRTSINGTRFDAKHHGRGATLPWTAGGNANRLAAQLVHDYYSDPPEERPHVALRAHVHRHADSGDLHPIRAIFAWPWQVSSVYGHKVDSGAGVTPVGGRIFWCDGDHYETAHHWWKPARAPMVML